MAAFADLSELVNRLSGGNSGTPRAMWFTKDNRVDAAAAAATVAGRMTSLWRYNGTPSNGAVPGAVAAPTNTTAGGLIQADPGGGRQLWMTGGWALASVAGTLIVYDRLLHISGLDGTVTTAQTVGGSLTRYTGASDSVGNQIWVEIYTAIGGTGTTAVVNYTDQDNNPAVSPAFAIGAAGLQEAQRIIPVPLQAGGTGVRGVTDIDLVATTGTAGNFGITVARPLLYIPVPAPGVGYVRDLIAGQPGLQEVLTDACLSLAWMSNGTTAPWLTGGVQLVER